MPNNLCIPNIGTFSVENTNKPRFWHYYFLFGSHNVIHLEEGHFGPGVSVPGVFGS